jgi:hypothetical protein
MYSGRLDVHEENKDREQVQSEKQNETIEIEKEERQTEHQNEEECSKNIEQNSNKNPRLFCSFLIDASLSLALIDPDLPFFLFDCPFGFLPESFTLFLLLFCSIFLLHTT